MTKTAVRNFFNHPEFQTENKAWWLGDIGYLLFDRSLFMLKGRGTDKPILLLIQRLKDISFLAYTKERGVIIGSKAMTREGLKAY